jgi:hypothetical protein
LDKIIPVVLVVEFLGSPEGSLGSSCDAIPAAAAAVGGAVEAKLAVETEGAEVGKIFDAAGFEYSFVFVHKIDKIDNTQIKYEGEMSEFETITPALGVILVVNHVV